MPLETLVGPRLPQLLRQAQTLLGSEAVILQVRHRAGAFEVIASDRGDGPPQPAPRTPDFGRVLADMKKVMPARPVVRPVVPPTKAPNFSLPAPVVSRPTPKAPAPVAARPAPARPRTVAATPAPRRSGPVIIVVAGPTGAGKTTTLAKLAAHPAAYLKRKVGFLGLDTYRVGAVDQLTQYAELTRRPLEVVYDVSELDRALKRLSSCDVILVDTPGRGPGRKNDAANVAQLLKRLRPQEVHLAIPAGLRPDHVRAVVKNFAPYGVTHLLPTKLDEQPTDTSVLDAAAELVLPVRWITNGQEVPRDLRLAPRAIVGAPRPASRVGATEAA